MEEVRLAKGPGVTSATVDFDKKTASITFDPEKANPATLAKSDFGCRLSFHCAPESTGRNLFQLRCEGTGA
jgi:copper chaperone CopZ